MDHGTHWRVNENVTSLRNRSRPKLPPSASQNHLEQNFCQECTVCQSILSPSLTLTWCALLWTTPVGTSPPTWWSCGKTLWRVWLDGLHILGVSIMWIKHNCPSTDLVLYKSDVSAAYCQLLMHSLYQILQIITISGQRYIDRSNNFGGCTSQIIWQSFMLLVIWILVFRHSIGMLKCYVDDAFSVTRAEDVCWYKPFCWAILMDQAKILHL